MMPAVAVPVPSRQPTDQLYQRPGKKRRVQSEARTKPLHRTALDAQGYCAEAEQGGLPDNVRPGADGPPSGGVGDEEDGFDRLRPRDGRRPDRVARFGSAGNARTDRRTGHVTDERHQDASDTFPVAVCQRDAQQRQVPSHCAGKHIP
jgi:hypothetical protein